MLSVIVFSYKCKRSREPSTPSLRTVDLSNLSFIVFTYKYGEATIYVRMELNRETPCTETSGTQPSVCIRITWVHFSKWIIGSLSPETVSLGWGTAFPRVCILILTRRVICRWSKDYNCRKTAWNLRLTYLFGMHENASNLEKRVKLWQFLLNGQWESSEWFQCLGK